MAVTRWLTAGLEVPRRTFDAVTALPRIALALERLADSTDDLRRIADAAPAVQSLADVAAELREAMATLGPLADTVGELNRVVASLSTTVSPLQGASERLGRLVDRLPASKSRRIVDVDPRL